MKKRKFAGSSTTPEIRHSNISMVILISSNTRIKEEAVVDNTNRTITTICAVPKMVANAVVEDIEEAVNNNNSVEDNSKGDPVEEVK